MELMGNSRGRAVYEASLPDNYRRPQTDSLLETFIRAKYEHKKWIAKEWNQPTLPNPNWDKEIEESIKIKKKAASAGALPESGKIKMPPVTAAAASAGQPGPPKKIELANGSNIANSIQTASHDLLQLGINNNTNNESNTIVENAMANDLANILLIDGPATSTTPTTAATTPQATDQSQSSHLNLLTNNIELGSMGTTTPGNQMMTKESILSLYSNKSSQPNPTSNPFINFTSQQTVLGQPQGQGQAQATAGNNYQFYNNSSQGGLDFGLGLGQQQQQPSQHQQQQVNIMESYYEI